MINEMIILDIICLVIVTVLLMEMAGLFLKQYLKSHELLSLLLTIISCAFCISGIFYFLRFFVIGDPFFYRMEVVLRFISFTTFVFMFERKGRERSFPFLTVLCIACILAIFILPYDLAYFLGFTIYGAALAVLWFLIRTYRNTDGRIRHNIGRAIIGGFILGIGIGLSADYIVQLGGQYLIAVGLIVQLIGMILLGLSFYGIRTTDEFLWYSEVKDLFVIFNSICLYAYSFEQDSNLKEADLYGGGLASVLFVAQSIMNSQEPPEHIVYQNLNFIVRLGTQKFSNNRLIAVLMVKKNLSILHEKLEKFLNAFENQFKDVLIHWTGDTEPFIKNSKNLNQIFRLRIR